MIVVRRVVIRFEHVGSARAPLLRCPEFRVHAHPSASTVPLRTEQLSELFASPPFNASVLLVSRSANSANLHKKKEDGFSTTVS